jgi:proline dehydrogenase
MKLLYPLAKRFIAGHDFNSAKPRIQKLIDEGYEVSIDYLGELSSTVLDCERAKNQYVEIINFYKLQKVDISIKPSQLGLLIHPLLS